MTKLMMLVVLIIILNVIMLILSFTLKLKKTLTHEEKIAKVFKGKGLDYYI